MAVSAGIVFWFFLDVMNDAVLLDVNQGFGGGLDHALLAVLFAVGFLLLFGLERAFSKSPIRKTRGERTGRAMEISFTIAVLVALGIGFHALAEGIEIGSLIPSATNIVDTIGGLSAGFAYVLHKFLEGFVIGVVAVFAKSKPRAFSSSVWSPEFRRSLDRPRTLDAYQFSVFLCSGRRGRCLC